MQRNQVSGVKGSTGWTVLYSVAMTTDVLAYDGEPGAAEVSSLCTKLGHGEGAVASAHFCPPVQIEVGYL